MYLGVASKEFPLQNNGHGLWGGIEAKGTACHEGIAHPLCTQQLSQQLCNRGKIMDSSFEGNCLAALIFPASGRASRLLFDQAKSKCLSGMRTDWKLSNYCIN